MGGVDEREGDRMPRRPDKINWHERWEEEREAKKSGEELASGRDFREKIEQTDR